MGNQDRVQEFISRAQGAIDAFKRHGFSLERVRQMAKLYCEFQEIVEHLILECGLSPEQVASTGLGAIERPLSEGAFCRIGL